MAAVCEFDRLFTKRVPHIHEKIFFSLDYKSFKNCLEVSKPWNDMLTTESFLRKGKSVFCKDIKKDLLRAAKRGNVDLIRKVLSIFLVDINFMTKRNTNPLMLAAKNNHKDVVYLLLDRGAEPNMADQDGNTPLHEAANEGHKDVVQLLLDGGAEPNRADQDGWTPLHDAADEGHKDVVQLLLDGGAEPNMAEQSGDTPLHRASLEGHKVVVQLLLEKGAEPNMATLVGITPLSCAIERGHTEIANILRENRGTV